MVVVLIRIVFPVPNVSLPTMLLPRSLPALVLLATASAALAANELPLAPKDWQVQVIAQPPQLIHPSVVTCAPDGRVFVAQDPIDMSLPSDSAGDSILCIFPDGKITTFAENLHAVFGLCYLDGKLYVHHTPVFSVFTDDNGVGRDRRDLFTTNPNPNLAGKGFNDHVPSNVRPGMDGWLYMSSGDKGIFGAVGKDGSKVDLRGGGIMRFRPDGTHLEIYATGTRNHLDIAINAEQEMFTYDNTDDGNGWWTRVTHMVDAGFYGYPFDYKPRRPYTLWMMTDYGGGSGTGAIAYNEDALPEEYRGNLFLEDWTRKQLLRLKISRDGATYKVDERVQTDGKDFLTQGSTDFRPVGIAVSPDGLSFYIADWNFGGWRQKKIAGRLLKVTYTGKSLAAPKPAWFVPAASGKPFKATEAELVAALKHPAESVRLVAQRRLAERGTAVVPALQALLADRTAPPHARWHAVWALDAIDAGAFARKEILAVAAGTDDAAVRAQAIRQLGSRHVATAVPALTAALRDANPVIRFQSATALGRIGASEAVSALLPALDESDFFTRYAVFTALHRIGLAHPEAWEKIATGFSDEKPAVREGTLFAMRETFSEKTADTLAALVVSPKTTVESRKAALGALAELHRLAAPWDGKWWGTQPVLREKPTPKTETWSKTSVVQDAVRFSLRDADESVRRTAVNAAATSLATGAGPELRTMWLREPALDFRQSILRTLGTIKDPEAGAIAASVIDSHVMLNDAITVAGQIGDARALAALTRLGESETNPDVLVRVIEAFGAAKSPSSAPLLGKFLEHADAKVRTAAGLALGNIGGAAASEVVLPLLAAEKVDTRRAAITAAGQIKDKNTVPKLLELAHNPDTETEAANALAAMPDVRALDIYLDALVRGTRPGGRGGNNPPGPPAGGGGGRGGARVALALEAIKTEALPHIEERHRAKPFTGQALASLQRIYNQNDQALAGPLFEGASKPVDRTAYQTFALRESGDVTRGKSFFEGAATCTACHRVNGNGNLIGPDLSDIGTKYDRAALIESVLYPSKQILDGYHNTTVTLKNGTAYNGFLRNQSDDELTLVDAAGEKHIVKRSDVAKNEETAASLMPEGLQSTLSLAEFADLIGFLESLKAKPTTKSE
jgi:putative membrane-bound dehydrogenase-like protein